MRRLNVDGIVLLIAAVFTVLAIYIYLRKDDSQLGRFTEVADNIKVNISSLEAQVNKMTEAQQALLNSTVKDIGDLSTRLKALEQKRNDPVKVSMAEPIKINLIYKKSENKLPQVPKPLLKRAGILGEKN